MNQAGVLVREEAFSAFGPLVSANQAAAQYGPLASTRAVDAFLVTVANTGAATLVDQNGVSTVFATGSLVLGRVYHLSPSRFAEVGGGSYVPLYR